jgi:IclR family pca regulon transcriptional regulator
MDPSSETETESAGIPRSAPTRTLEKGLFLLGLFDADHPEWTLKELRERAGLPKATTRRLMKTLEASHWVACDGDSGMYHLGSSALRVAFLVSSHAQLVRIAHPYLLRLAAETTESCRLTVWTDNGAMIVDNVPTSRLFKYRVYDGMVLGGLASANAKALVAFEPEEAWDDLLAVPIQPRTPHTVTDPELVREQWRTIRQTGVAFDWGEWNAEAPAVAAPVFDRDGHVRASISVVVPVERASEETMQKIAQAVKRSAAEVSAQLASLRG